jgi:hypothetical protein
MTLFNQHRDTQLRCLGESARTGFDPVAEVKGRAGRSLDFNEAHFHGIPSPQPSPRRGEGAKYLP